MDEKAEKRITYLKIANKNLKNRNSVLYFKNSELEEKVQRLNVILIIESSIILVVFSAAITLILLKK
ncbi:hypothetical protein VNN36_04525 [Lactococcus garvieae]|uniref:hypothetical protein n=1 Tax=Lactococcus garvieae TaxID=1363 RepID=UPI0030CC33CB